MKQETPTKREIRHRRLYAFFESKILNAMMIAISSFLCLMAYPPTQELGVCGAITALALFIGYSLWLWIKKPQRIIINRRFSLFSTVYCFYFLILLLFHPTEIGWLYLFPAVFIIIFLFIAMMKNVDETFDI